MSSVVHVKKARKANKAAGIEKGQEYWYWSHQVGGRFVKTYFKKQPTRSQTTSSEFYATAYGLEDDWFDFVQKVSKGEYLPDGDLAGDVRNTSGEVRSLGEEQLEKHDNMPEGLQESETGQLLQERSDACESLADELDSAADEIEGQEDDTDWQDNVLGILEGISWDL